MSTDRETTLQELKDAVAQFREERGWRKHHTPKNLAISIALEAAELLEHYQWDEYRKSDEAEEIASELADILMYVFNFADVNDIDISSSFYRKLDHAKQKYPVEKFNKDSLNNDEYFRIKQNYKAKGLNK